jgi:hypothetical protein
MKLSYVGWRRPFCHLYQMFEGWMFVLGPLSLEWKAKPPAPILTHIWKAFGYHGAGTVISPRPMDESEALAWVATFGSVAYVDREAGFIFYRPKE